MIAAAFASIAGCDAAPVGTDAGMLDAGLLDGAMTDAGASDVGLDAAPASPFCRPCRRDIECGPGALCLFLAGGERACGVPCVGDADCAGLRLAAACEEEAPGLPLSCRPTGLDCSPSSPGSPCGAGCAGTYDRCIDPEGLGAYCTTACTSNADCPTGLRRCAAVGSERVCVRDEASPAERCTAIADAGLGTRCAADGSCPGGGTCFGTGPVRLCLSAPAAGGACPSGHVAMTTATGLACVPHVAVAGAPLSEVAPDCSCALDDDGLFLEAAALAGRSRCELRFESSLLDRYPPSLAHDRFRLAATDRMHLDWLAAPAMGAELGGRLDAEAASATASASMLREAGLLADLSMPDAPTAPGATDLVAELVGLATEAGGVLDAGAASAALAPIPSDVALALARVVAAVRVAIAERERVLASFEPLERTRLFAVPSGLFLASVPDSAVPAEDWLIGALLGDVDVGALARAAADVAAAVDALRPLVPATLAATVRVDVVTPIGRISIRGTGDDTYASTDGATLLVVDLGGNDTYRTAVGATASATNGVSVLVDLGGVDDYAYDEVPHPRDVGPAGHRRLPSDGAGRADPAPAASDGPRSLSNASRQGAGRLGIGLLYDLGMDGDHYRSLRMSQGYGALGVGMLFDEGGSDVYEGEAATQGAASAGVGLLVDLGGDDEYVAYHASQAFAYTRGVGVLYDAAGTDTYFAHPSDVLYWSPQNPGGSNSSFCQAAGFGRRDDGRGLYMSGGIAILRDAVGDDRYTCGIFGQATGYWFGAGLLLEGAGADHYDGEWYVQAGNAHFAIALLLDEGGNDVYGETAMRRNVALGGGHDFSVAWLLDRGGDDVYRAPGISFGVGHAGGFGGFVDLGGTDSYDTFSDLSFGDASIETPGDMARRASGTVGIFVDRGGTDTYARPTLSPVTDEGSWTQSQNVGESENGAGIDRAVGVVGVGLD